MTIAGLHHLGLTVTDLDVSVEWYSTVLGFVHTGGYVSPDGRRRKAFLRHAGLEVRIGLCQHGPSADGSFDETRPGLDHLAFAVGDVDELRVWEQRFNSRGVIYTPAAPMNTVAGGHVLVLRDPDNIQLELVAIDD